MVLMRASSASSAAASAALAKNMRMAIASMVSMPVTLWISQPLKPVAIDCSAFVMRLGEKNMRRLDHNPLPDTHTSLRATPRTTSSFTSSATMPAAFPMILDGLVQRRDVVPAPPCR